MLGKALGSYGAFACCNAEIASFLVNRARTVIYSTALPPPALGAALAAVDLLCEDHTPLVGRRPARARVLREQLACQGFTVEPGTMPIVPLMVGDPQKAVALADAALEKRVFAQAIGPPTVPAGTSRLRLVATAAHGEDELRAAARTLAAASPAVEPERIHINSERAEVP